MRGDAILVQTSPGERRIAATRDGVLTDYAVWRPGAPDGVGDVHMARVMAVVPAMAGSFLALDGQEAFLPDSETPSPVTAGDHLTVRVTRAAQSGKGPRVSARGDLPAADGKPRLLQTGPTPLDRLAAAWPDAAIGVDDAALFAVWQPAYGPRLSLARPAWHEALAADIDGLADPVFALPHGLLGTVAQTAALTAIDIDAGTATAARSEKSRAQSAVNLAALPALARQIRLRNLSGAILIDFAGMPAKRRAALAPALTEALQTDPLHPRLLGFTKLGFAEILRPRVAPPLAELLRGAHAEGLRALRQAVPFCNVQPASLRAAPAVIAALERDAGALAELARRATYPLMLKSDPTLKADGWSLESSRA
jgi:Ribonuclease G/E